jgi:predicted HD phosphohydrolase|tara:strand:+ start:395 stop:1156 length:762 start_codon:yes stop_codon:yes gene_type:complete
MKQLTEQQIVDNWNKLIKLIEDTFDGERKEKLLKMYKYFENRMSIAPASGKAHYHNAMVGGYVEHVLHVTDCAIQIKNLWESNGAEINFTDEELIFAAMHHDLGKVGDLEEDYYIPQDSDWHRKNQGSIFKHNPKLQYMSVTDRAIFLLGHFKIPMSQWEYIGLKLTDGMYEEANKTYYMSYNPDWALKSNIAYILHQADMMATHIEGDEWKRADEEVSNNFKKAVVTEEKPQPSEKLSEKSQDLFDELFGDK